MRRVFAVSTFLLLMLVVPASSQTCAADFAWATGMGGTTEDFGYGIAVDGSGSTYVTGHFYGTATFGSITLTAAGGADIFVVKLNPTGTVVWARGMGGVYNDTGYGIAVDGSGSTYVTGHFLGTVTFGSITLTPGNIFVAKLDSSGNFLWARGEGTANEDFGYGYSIAVDGSGSAYVTGRFRETATFGPYTLTSAGALDIFVAKLDSSGNFLWARGMGGMTEDYGVGIAVDGSGNAYVAGAFQDTATFGPYTLTAAGGIDIFVVKLDNSGNVLWLQRMGGTNNDYGVGIAVDGSGSAYVTGYFYGTATFGGYTFTSPTPGTPDIFVVKLDNGGNGLWAKGMGGTTEDFGYGIAVDGSGSAYVTGRFFHTATFGPYTLTAVNSSDIFVAKLDSSGNVLWANSMDGMVDIGIARSIAVDGSGSAYVTGHFLGSATFGPYTLTSAPDSFDIFVFKLRGCSSGFVEESGYSSMLFRPLCTRNASALTQDVYNSKPLGIFKGLNDRFFLSSQGTQFSSLVVDDAVHMNGVGTGLGPYSHQPGVPPYLYDAPIEQNLQPLPAHNVTSFIPPGGSSVLFELLDTQRAIYGNTAVYLVRDCGIWLAGRGPTMINWVNHDDQVNATSTDFDVRYGRLSHLRADHNFSRASCLGHYLSTPATETLPNPPSGDGHYYLARALASQNGCYSQGYGDSSLVPDPRDALDALPTCP